MLNLFVLIVCLIKSASFQTTENTCEPNSNFNSSVPHADNCSMYNICQAGQVSLTAACLDPSKAFDIFDLGCKENAHCFSKTNVSCSRFPGRQRVPSPVSCREYIDCYNGSQLTSCPEYFPFFDYQSMECRVEEQVFCYPLSSKAEDPDSSTINTCLPNIGFTFSFPHESDCTLSHKCHNGVITLNETCEALMLFDYVELKCVPKDEAVCFPGKSISCTSTPQNVLLPHPDLCTKYLDCTSNLQEKACPLETPYFHFQLLKCMKDHEVLCYPGTVK